MLENLRDGLRIIVSLQLRASTLRRVGMFITGHFRYPYLNYYVCFYTRDAGSCNRLRHHWRCDTASAIPCLRATLVDRTGEAHGLQENFFIPIYARNVLVKRMSLCGRSMSITVSVPIATDRVIVTNLVAWG